MTVEAYVVGADLALHRLGLTKHAGRMEAALRAGEITAEELFPQLSRAPKNISAIRQRLAKPSRAPDLAALRKKRELGMAGHVKIPGVERTEAHVITAPTTDAMGATQPVGGRVRKGTVGAKLGPSGLPKKLSKSLKKEWKGKKQPKLLISAGARRGRKFTLPSTLQHELAEARLWRQAEKMKDANPFASHLGSEPLLAERLYAVGDPQLQGHYDKLRRLHSEDKRVTELMREMGHTADRPMPIGGKQHRALEKRIRELKERGEFSRGTLDREHSFAMAYDLGPKRDLKAQQARGRERLLGTRKYLSPRDAKKLEAAEAKAEASRRALAEKMQGERAYLRYLLRKVPPERLKDMAAVGRLQQKADELRQVATAMNRGRPFESAAEARAASKEWAQRQLEALKEVHDPEMPLPTAEQIRKGPIRRGT